MRRRLIRSSLTNAVDLKHKEEIYGVFSTVRTCDA